jgi:hypothetical protein
MSIPEVDANPPLRLLLAFQEAYPAVSPEHILKAPGRDMWIAAVAGQTDGYTIHAPDMTGRTTFNWRTAKNRRTILNRPLPKWARYPAGVIVELGNMDMDAPPLDAIVVGEEPSGPRYEFSMGIVVAALWHQLNDLTYTAESLLDIGDRVRRDYIDS